MATVDVLAGRLTIDTTAFTGGLQAAASAAQRFAAQINQAMNGIGAPKPIEFDAVAKGLNGAAKAARKLTESLDKPLLGAKSKIEAVAKETERIGNIAKGGSGLAKWAAQIIEHSQAAEGALARVGASTDQLAERLRKAGEGLEWLKTAGDAAKPLYWDTLVAALETVGDVLQEVATAIVDAATPAFQAMYGEGGLLSTVIKGVWEILKSLWEVIKSLALTIWQILKPPLRWFWEILKGLFSVIGSVLRVTWDVVKVVLHWAGVLQGSMVISLQTAVRWVLFLVEAIFKLIRLDFKGIKERFKEVAAESQKDAERMRELWAGETKKAAEESVLVEAAAAEQRLEIERGLQEKRSELTKGEPPGTPTSAAENASDAVGQRSVHDSDAVDCKCGGSADTKAYEDGARGTKALSDAAIKAGVDINKLDEAEQARAAHAKSELTPQEQEAQQQMKQQQEDMQKKIEAAMHAANEQSKAIWEGMFGGAEQVEAMIREAAAQGDMKYAMQLIRQRLEVQLKVSKSNLHQLASDPMAGGGFGPEHGGVANDAYFMTLDIPLVRLIKFLQDQLDHLPKLASGGILTRPTAAVVGEAGPEAVLPLTSFANMLGSLPVFSQIHNAMERMGDWLSMSGPGMGSDPALAQRYFTTLSRIEKTFETTTDVLDHARRIDFTPASMHHGMPAVSGGAAGSLGLRGAVAERPGLNITGIHINVHGADVSSPATLQTMAQRIFPAIEAEANRRGYDMTGRSVLRSSPAALGRGVGYPR